MNLLELSSFLCENKKQDLAVQVLKVFESQANTIEQMEEIIIIYDKLHQYKEIVELAKKALEISSPKEEYELNVNLTRIYNLLNEPHKSLELADKVLKIKPDNINVIIERTLSLTSLNKRDEAYEILFELEKYIIDEDILDVITHNLSSYYLKNHEFNKGLSGLWNKAKPKEEMRYNLEYWDKTPIKDAVLMIDTYGGYGDEIINIRFMENIKQLGMIPVWKTHRKDIRDIVTRLGYRAIEHVSELDSTKFTVWCVGMRLPYLLNLQEHEINTGAYLTATPESIEKFKKYRGYVGIKHFGETGYEHNLHRTLDLDELISNIPENKKLISLHQEPIHSELREIIDVSSELKTFEDTLGLIYNLEYVVSSCTSVPHAAGALGKETYILTPIFQYYLWDSTTDESTIWYDNVTLLRQVEWKCWKEPMKRLKTILTNKQ